MRILLSIGAVAFAAGLGATAGTALAASAVQKECSTKYKAAKAANTLNGLTYNEYYSQCAKDAKAEKPAAATPAAPTPAATPPAPVTPAPAPKTAAKPAPTAPAAAGAPVFPAAVSPTYSKETAGKARFHTCLDQYNSNKAANGNGGLKWIQKGGGYYSECNKKLKS